MQDFISALCSGKVLVMDGAMGTEIMRRAGQCVDDAGLINTIHRDYVDAGADVVLTNTFQANPVELAKRGDERTLHSIWDAAIRLAKAGRPRFVLADIGPIEKLTVEIAAQVLAECVDVDAVLLETLSSLVELKGFVDRRRNDRLPVLVSFTFHRTKALMTFQGISPEHCAREAQRYGASAIGANCGKEIGMDDMLEIVKRYRGACDLPIFVKPNAGTPLRSGLRYPRTPIAMAAALMPLLEAGIAMIGGCCGTTPEHIREFRAVVDEWNRRPV